MNNLESRKQDVLQWLAGRSARLMFWLSLTFLAGVACLVVLWVDVPNLHEATGLAKSVSLDDIKLKSASETLGYVVLVSLLTMWPIFILESIAHWLTRPWDAKHRKCHWFSLWICLCPALRMCARLPEMGDRVWLPAFGWRRPDKRLRRRLERTFSVPMIVIALMIMPILIIEFFFKAQVAQYQLLRFMMHLGTGVIWFAFAVEFILMVSVAEKKLAYCKKHWVDLAIILLPLFSFLRSLRALRATRVAKLMRVPQIGKLARVYRLRGTAIKAVQALVLLEVFQRLFSSSPEKTIAKLQQQLLEVEDDARQLRRKIARLQRRVDQESPAQPDGLSESESAQREETGETKTAESESGSSVHGKFVRCD